MYYLGRQGGIVDWWLVDWGWGRSGQLHGCYMDTTPMYYSYYSVTYLVGLDHRWVCVSVCVCVWSRCVDQVVVSWYTVGQIYLLWFRQSRGP